MIDRGAIEPDAFTLVRCRFSTRSSGTPPKASGLAIALLVGPRIIEPADDSAGGLSAQHAVEEARTEVQTIKDVQAEARRQLGADFDAAATVTVRIELR